MRFNKKVISALVVALVVFFLAMAIEIVPCKKAPQVPNPHYDWSFCNINPDSTSPQGMQKLYLGYSKTLTETYITLIVLVFALVFIFLTLVTKQKKDS